MEKINIVSGKGGTGKTLISAVIADLLGNKGQKVIVADFDIFVRGLTTLLYFHRNEKMNLLDKKELSISDFLVGDKLSNSRIEKRSLGITRYRSFDVVPSVSRLDKIINFEDIIPNDKRQACSMIELILKKVPKDYDFALIDSRAGYDELVSATHIMCDYSICVQEEDNVSTFTSDNLVRQLRNDSDNTVFRITNKVRNISRDKSSRGKISRINNLGEIPFDMDVKKSFGERRFWSDISDSVFRVELAESWNKLSDKMEYEIRLSISRSSPVASEKLEGVLTNLKSTDRILLLYTVLISIAGILYGLAPGIIHEISTDPVRMASFLVGILSMLMSYYIFLTR